ncbi:hypothetical protein CLOM_g1935 [Closterium sp. NIES-68]|nr:hypothetical protein CLOM_g1935 [Closterium sp. NIES-68]GJP82474.1 hypothetical protein CLOP_g12729 [Closterium sp. NIES-67]
MDAGKPSICTALRMHGNPTERHLSLAVATSTSASSAVSEAKFSPGPIPSHAMLLFFACAPCFPGSPPLRLLISPSPSNRKPMAHGACLSRPPA